MPEPPERSLFIHGGPRATGDVAEVRSPWSGKVVTRYHRGGAKDLTDAIASAAEGFEAMRRKATWERGAILDAAADGVGRRREELVQVLVDEAGKPLKAARAEAERSVHTFRVAAEEARRLGGDVIPLDTVPWGAGHFGLTRRFPVGV